MEPKFDSSGSDATRAARTIAPVGADIEIQAEEILKTKQTLINVMAKCCGQTPERVQEDSERDRFFDAKQAVAYGICDEVLEDAASGRERAGAESLRTSAGSPARCS